MEQPKSYLYHMKPAEMREDEAGRKILHPLNVLKEKFPDLYELEAGKYSDSEDRKSIPHTLIPTLEKAAWGDAIQLTAVHPEDLKKALVEAGFHPKELKFYQIDPDLLDPAKTAVYLYREDVGDEDPANYSPLSAEELPKYSVIPERTKEYYKEQLAREERPMLFVGVPHILHKGSLDVSNLDVITV